MRDWDDLRFLLSFSRAGSLAQAAAEMGVDKATVSRRLAALSDGWGVRVVEKVGASARVAPEAAALVELAARIEAMARAAEAEVGDAGARGPVRLTLPSFVATHLVTPALPAFGAAHPDVRVELVVTDQVVDLLRRDADVAVRNVRTDQPGLVGRRVGDIHYGMYAAPAYLARVGVPAGAQDLAGHAVVVGTREPYVATGFRWLPERAGRVAFRASDLSAQREALVAGLGLGVQPCLVGDADPGLTRLAGFPLTRDPVWALWPEDLRGVARVAAVVDLVGRVFAAERLRLCPPGPA